MSSRYSSARFERPLRLGLVLALLAATAGLASVPLQPLNRLSGAAGLKVRITAEIRNATVEEAAEKVSKALGARIVLHDHLTGYSENWVLDRNRRATLSWKDAPLGRVMRDFCRAYRCTLRSDGRNTYSFWPYLPPRAALRSAAGYRFEVENAYYQTPSGSLNLSISASADNGDGAALARLEKIRVVDVDGRRVEQSAPTDLNASNYPDARTGDVGFAWPHPAPKKLKSVEGVIRAYRNVRRLEVEVPFPRGNEETLAEVGGVRVTLSDIAFRSGSEPKGPGALFDPGGFRGTMKLTSDKELSVVFDGNPSFCEAVFEDGTRSLVDARLISPQGVGHLVSRPGQEYAGKVWSDSGPKRRPVRLIVPLIVRSGMLESIPFRVSGIGMQDRNRGQ